MIRALFYQIVYRLADIQHRRSERARAWAWNKIIEGWPAEVASEILRKAGH